MSKEILPYKQLFKLIDHTNRGYVTLKQIRNAILQPTERNTRVTCNIYNHCILIEPRIFIFMLDLEFIQSQLLEYSSYYLKLEDFVDFMVKLYNMYKTKCDNYVNELYDICNKIIIEEEQEKDSDDSDSEDEDERKRNYGKEKQPQPKDTIKWHKFKSLVTKNKVVKEKIQEATNVAYRFISQPRFYADKWFKQFISKEQLVQFLDRSRFDILSLRTNILKQVHATINKICKTVDDKHIEKIVAVNALTKDRQVHKLLQKAPGMQIFSLPNLTSEYIKEYPTKRSGEMNIIEFLQAMDNVESTRFRKVDLRSFYDKFDINVETGCVDRTEVIQCLKDLNRQRYEAHKEILVITKRFPVLFYRDVIVDKMRELDTYIMGEVSFEEFFKFAQELDFEHKDRLTIEKSFNYIHNHIEDHHRSVLDKGKKDHHNAQRIQKDSVVAFFTDTDTIREEFIDELSSERKVFEFFLNVKDIATQYIYNYHTKKGDSFSFEEYTECMFIIRENYLHRMACFELFRSLNDKALLESKTSDDVDEKKDDDSNTTADEIFISYSMLKNAINDEWESFPTCRSIITDHINMLGLLLDNSRLSLNHTFFHITKEEIEEVIRDIKKKKEKRKMMQKIMQGFTFDRFCNYILNLYETTKERQLCIQLYDGLALAIPEDAETKMNGQTFFGGANDGDDGEDDDTIKIPKEINIEAFKLFFSDKKYANMRDEIGKEFRNNEFPNLLLHPEIIFQYMEHREINVVTWMQFFEIVSDLLKTYRNRIILHEIYSNIKEKANQTLFPQLLFDGIQENHLLVSKVDKCNIIQQSNLYSEGLLEIHNGLRKPVSYEQFYNFIESKQPQLKYRRILRVLFDLIDDDNSESIDKREVLRAFLRNNKVRDILLKMESLQVLQKPELFEQAFLAMDTSGDGEVSFEEFVTFALASQAENDAKMAQRKKHGGSDESKYDDENPHAKALKQIQEEVKQMSEKLNADEIIVKTKKEEYEKANDDLRILMEDLQIKENQFRGLKKAAAIAAGEDVDDSEDDADTPRDMWDVLRQQKGDDADMVRDKMYEGPYGIDEANESTTVIYEELHGLQELFDNMWESVTGNKPKDPYEYMIQNLRGFQASRRVKLGIDLTLRDVNDHLDKNLREQLWIACRDDKPQLIQQAMEVHEINQNHRCFYVDMHNLRLGDECPGYGYELEPSYHKGYDSTCLHVSAWFGSNNCVKFLIDNFADTSIVDIMRRSPIDVAKNDPCKLLLHHGYQRNNWSEYHNPMIPVKREALQTHWRKKKAHQGTKWKRRFDDRQDRYQEDKLLQPPKGVTIEQHNSITWLTGEKKIEVNKSGKKK